MVVIIPIMILVIALQIPNLVRRKEYWDLFILLIFWLIAGVYVFFVVTDRPLLSPFELIIDITDRVTNLVY